MDKILELRKKAAAAIRAAQELQAAAEAENRSLTNEEAAKVDELLDSAEKSQAEANALEADVKRARRLESAATALAAPAPAPLAVMPAVPNDDARRRLYAVPRDHEEEGRAGFANVGEYAHAIAQAALYPHVGLDPRLQPRAETAQRTGAQLGFTVPTTFSTAIWEGMAGMSDNLLALCDEYDVQGDKLEMLRNAESSRANGSRWGGVLGYWIKEGATLTPSDAKLGALELEPQELAVFVKVTEKQLNNSSIALSQYITRASSDEINFLVGDSIINGSGAGKPLGILNSNALITVAKEASQAADTINQENIARMWKRCPARLRSTAVWLLNQDCEDQLDLMVTNVKNVAGTENVGGFTAGLYNPDRGTLKGKPVIFTEWNATLGDLGDIVLADLRSYAVGRRMSQGIRAATSMHIYFDQAKMAFRFMFEVDGRPWPAGPLTPFKGSNTLSPFVALAARA